MVEEIYNLKSGIPYLSLLVDALQWVAWPLALYFVARSFKDEVKDLLPRIRKVGPTGAEFSPDNQNALSPVTEARTTGELKDLRGQERTNAIRAVETDLHASTALIDKEEQIDVIIRDLAQARLDTHFALTYNSIFGSQISFLKLLRDRGRMARQDAQTYFADTQNRIEDFNSWSLETYMSFLEAQKLITIDDSGVVITEIGNDFLLFLYRFRLTENKPL